MRSSAARKHRRSTTSARDSLTGVLSEAKRTLVERRKALVLLIILLISSASQPQVRRTDEILATPQLWNSETLRLFKDSDKEITFSLATSWIPGDNHRGLFRYRIKGLPVELSATQRALEMNIPEAYEKLLIRAHACSMGLELYDSDQFILRKIPIPFFNYLSSDGKVTGLSLNEAVQMDASEYRRLCGTPSQSGSWGLSWNCGEIP